MEVKIIANVNQLPRKDFKAVQHADPVKALAELEHIAKRDGLKLGQVYNWGGSYFYAVIEGKA